MQRTSPRAWGLRQREAPHPQAICAVRMLLSGQQNGVSTSEFDPFRCSIPSPWSPLERFELSLAAIPRITRGRGGWLDLTPWTTFTSYPLPACPGALRNGSTPTVKMGHGARPIYHKLQIVWEQSGNATIIRRLMTFCLRVR